MDIKALLAECTRVEGECHIWVGSFNRGRKSPRIWFDGKHHAVRRLLRPDLKAIGVSCRNLACVNPDHFIEATKSYASSYQKDRSVLTPFRAFVTLHRKQGKSFRCIAADLEKKGLFVSKKAIEDFCLRRGIEKGPKHTHPPEVLAMIKQLREQDYSRKQIIKVIQDSLQYRLTIGVLDRIIQTHKLQFGRRK